MVRPVDVVDAQPHDQVLPHLRQRQGPSVRKTVARTHAGRTYTIPDPAFWERPACAERVYDRDALRQIKARSPAYHKTRRAAAR